MSSFACKIGHFNRKIVEEKGPLPYNGKYLKEGVVKYYYELHNTHGVVAVAYDPQGVLIGRIQGWHKERLWVEDVEQSWVDTLGSHDEQVVFNYL
jgi:hypothetical protein